MSAEVVLNEAAIKELLESEDGDVAKDLQKRALRCVRVAKRLCPVDTGRLRSSITSELGKDGDGLLAVVGTNVEYAARIEFGFHGTDSLGREYDQEAQPFLLPALAAATESGG